MTKSQRAGAVRRKQAGNTGPTPTNVQHLQRKNHNNEKRILFKRPQ